MSGIKHDQPDKTPRSNRRWLLGAGSALTGATAVIGSPPASDVAGRSGIAPGLGLWPVLVG